MSRPFAVAAACALCLIAAPAAAKITKIEILSSEPAFGGASFGGVGAYDRLLGRAEGVLDPADPANSIIQDLTLAPRDAGLVHYSTAIEILKPHDLAKGNRTLFFEVNNRGNKLGIGAFDDGVTGTTPDRNGLTSPGDGWLMRQGYTMIWFGWEMDVEPKLGHLGLAPIVAKNDDGSPLTGIVRDELVADIATPTLPLWSSWQVHTYPDGTFDSYPPASLDNAASGPDGFQPTLMVRAREQDRREPIAAADWSFALCESGKSATPNDKHICYPKGFAPGRLYELTYRAKDPTVTGIGFAAARDLGAYLKTNAADNPVYRPDNLALLEGTSQSGRMVRSFLALGFNRDEAGKRVFDAAYPHIGGGLMPLNVRFSQSLRAWGEQVDHLYPAYDFPFTYARQSDPLTGRTQGILDRCRETDTCPKLFHVATALEMWEGRQSLGLTDPSGTRDVADPPEVRTFIMASTQHGPAALPLPTRAPFGNCEQQGNPNPQVYTMRALLTALVAWTRDGVAPPDSVVPRIADGTLVAADRVRFPEIPANAYGGVERQAVSNLRIFDNLHVLDYGPDYRAADSSGVLREPPRVGTASYGVLVPQVDPDGNDIGGVRSLILRAPIGTYTGWNLYRRDLFGSGLCNLQGSFIPFAATRAERLATGDTRLSLEERYPDKQAYVAAVELAARDLVASRLLLPEDADMLVAKARAEGVRKGP
jgi:hypothetical protein